MFQADIFSWKFKDKLGISPCIESIQIYPLIWTRFIRISLILLNLTKFADFKVQLFPIYFLLIVLKCEWCKITRFRSFDISISAARLLCVCDGIDNLSNYSTRQFPLKLHVQIPRDSFPLDCRFHHSVVSHTSVHCRVAPQLITSSPHSSLRAHSSISSFTNISNFIYSASCIQQLVNWSIPFLSSFSSLPLLLSLLSLPGWFSFSEISHIPSTALRLRFRSTHFWRRTTIFLDSFN